MRDIDAVCGPGCCLADSHRGLQLDVEALHWNKSKAPESLARPPLILTSPATLKCFGLAFDVAASAQLS
jgi:hypothetical protein